MKMKKLTLYLFPDSHKRICESGLSGLRHVVNGSDVDELLALQAGDVLTVRRKIAGRSRSPQIDIYCMPEPVQEIRAKTAQEDEQRQNCSIGKEEKNEESWYFRSQYDISEASRK
jgi:hypothetical protein